MLLKIKSSGGKDTDSKMENKSILRNKCYLYLTEFFAGMSVMAVETMYNLEDNLILFFTGYSHSAGNILEEQDKKSKKNDEDMLRNLDFVKQMGLDSRNALEKGDLNKFAEIMNIHWEYKKKRSGGMSNPKIDEWYEYALKNGALGGKLIGAGGGGFLMFYANDKVRLRSALNTVGLEEVRFRFEKEGAKLL